MVNFNRKVAVLLAIVFSLCCVQLASAAIYYTPTYANVSENFMLTLNITPQTSNITQIIIKNQANPPFAFNYTSNQTNIAQGLATFNLTGQALTWFNLTNTGLTNSSLNQTFTIVMNSTIAGAPSSNRLLICAYNSTDMTPGFAVRACGSSDPFFVENATITIGMNFGFSGTAKLENGSVQPNTNITIYDYIMSAGGPPSEVPIMSALTNANGVFRLWGINGSKSLYKMKISWANSTRVHYVGTNLPPFPHNMFYSIPPPPGAENMPMFKKMPNINGSTFYLQPAATINISARGNTTPGAIDVKFGYELIDQAVGFPIESNVRTGVWSQEVTVPITRSYTVIAMRDPMTFLPNYPLCMSAPGSMNDSACPAPPTSTQILSTNTGLIQGGYVNTVMNLSYTMQYLSGCLNVYGNNTLVNITKVITRMVPWEGFVPPMDAKISEFNITPGTGNDNLNYSDPRCAGSGNWNAFYNVSLMGSSSGISYLIEFYARNASTQAESPVSAVDLAMFQNLTMIEASKFINITLRPLAGQYQNSSTVNTTKVKIMVQNSTGGALTTSMHVEVKVKHPIFGTMHYIIEDISGGIAYLPILANSTWAKVSVYPNEAPPVEKTLNLNLAQNNITVQVGEMTFRKPLPNGSLQSINVSAGKDGADADSGITMTFYRNTEGCNTPNPPSSCMLTQMNANDFNPMVVMMAGKVNLELKMNASGTTLYFVNFDLLSAKPPTNSIMSNNASIASANSQVWESGSFVPHVYDYAYVVMPYSETKSALNYINESYTGFNISLPYLKDENWAVAWNGSNGSTTSSLPDDYTDFNAGIYAPLLTTGGVACNTTNASDVCYWDKTNNSFSMKVPHFSGIGSGITGLAPATAAAETPAAAGSSSGSTAETAIAESRTFSNIAADSENTYRISNAEGIGVNALLFTATEALENVRVEVTKLVSKPSSVSPTPSGGLYRYIEIDAPKLEGKLKQAIIQFEVTKKWLDDNDYEPEHIRLSRFVDNSWRELTTSIIREESDKVYYEATSPGFSYFAITAKKAAVEEESPAENVTAEETPAAPEIPSVAEEVKESITGNVVKTLLIIIGVLVVLFLAVLGYRKKHLLIFWREPTDKERQEILRGEFLNRKKQQSWGSGRD